MKNKIIKSILGILIITIVALALSGCTEGNVSNNKNTTEDAEAINCEHDWVVTSRYSFWADSYKTISKCSKCGKIVE